MPVNQLTGTRIVDDAQRSNGAAEFVVKFEQEATLTELTILLAVYWRSPNGDRYRSSWTQVSLMSSSEGHARTDIEN
jgi:hypothetical protein